jgi:CBS domain-containing protein
MKAREIMTSDPSMVVPTDKVVRAAEIMRDLKVGAVPVVEDTARPVLAGIITDRDIAVRCTVRGHDPSCAVREHMTRAPLHTVGPDEDVFEVIRQMELAQVRRIPVVDKKGMLLGVIAQADVATKVGPTDPRQIEELLARVSVPTPALVPAAAG